MIEINSNYDEDSSKIKISEDVISTIAYTAALEVDGVASMSSNFPDITEILGKKNFSKGVKIEIENDEIYINLNIIIKMNYKVHDVSEEVQLKVKSAVETMTGLKVNIVNINVISVVLDKFNNINDISQVEN